MRKDRRASQREIEFINEMVSPLSCGDEEDDEDDEDEDEEEEEPKKDEDDDDDDDDEEEEEPIWTATEWDRGATCWRKV
jgi:hypothetical protein